MMLRQTLLVVFCIAVALTGCAKKPLTPVTPWADVVDDSLGFFATSTDPGGLKVCYIFDWGDGSKTTTDYFESGDTCYCSHEFPDTRVHYIKVMSRNEKGVHSGWSPSLRFRLSEPPGLADTILGFRCGAADRWYHASVRVSDPDGDSVAVRFLWGDLPATDWSAYVPSGSIISDSCRWSVIGPHTVQVILKDKGCAVSRPSTNKTVNVSQIAVTWCKDTSYYAATPTLGTIDGEPVLYCGVVNTLDCYTLDGTLLWSTPVCGSDCAPSLSPDGSRLYLTDLDSGLVCLDARTGYRRWNLPLPTSEGSECTPAVGPNGALYIVVFGWEDYWLRRVADCGESAAVRWSARISDDFASSANSMAIGRNGVVYVVGQQYPPNTSVLVAIDSAGTTLWVDSTHLWFAGPPVIDGNDRVIVTDDGGGLYCFGTDGSLIYSAGSLDLSPGATAIGRNGEVIAADFNGYFAGYDSTGRALWSTTFGTSGSSTPCVTEESTVIVFDPDLDRVYGIGSDGRTLWEYSIDDSLGLDRTRARHTSEGEGKPSPVIGPNGDLYLAGLYGLCCLSGTNLHLANTAWPTYNHDNARSGWAGRQQR